MTIREEQFFVSRWSCIRIIDLWVQETLVGSTTLRVELGFHATDCKGSSALLPTHKLHFVHP